MVTIEAQSNELKRKSQEFHGEFNEVLSRIESVLNYYQENPDRLQAPENKKYVKDFLQTFYGLRTVFNDKYGFDVGMSEEKYIPEEDNKLVKFLPKNKTGINVDSEVLFRYSNIHDLASKTKRELEKK